MLFKRTIYDKFLSWKKETNGKKALLVEGARRIGKSTIVEEFAKNEYKSYILIDFARVSEEVKDYFRLYLGDLDTFYMLLSVQYGVRLFRGRASSYLTKSSCSPKPERPLNIWWLTAGMIFWRQAP